MSLLLALLLLAQERVVINAHHPRSSLAARVGDGVSSAFRRLFEKPDPTVAEGNAQAAQGDAQGALERYDKARAKLPQEGAQAGALAHDRATALLKLGAEKAPEALSESQRALAQGASDLKATASYDAALALEAMGKPDEALRAYAKALEYDPDDPDAKVNLELLLRTQEEKKQPQPQAGKQKEDQKQDQPQQDQKKQAQGQDQQNEQQPQQGDQKQEEKKEPQQKQAQEGQKKDEQQQQQPEAQRKPVDRSDAERLLDALRASEKNLQAWRFSREKRKDMRRGDAEKDW